MSGKGKGQASTGKNWGGNRSGSGRPTTAASLLRAGQQPGQTRLNFHVTPAYVQTSHGMLFSVSPELSNSHIRLHR